MVGDGEERTVALAEVVQFSELCERRAARERGLQEPWVSKREIAEHFGRSTRTIENWVRDRGMPHHKPYPTGNVYFRKSDCDRWFEGAA